MLVEIKKSIRYFIVIALALMITVLGVFVFYMLYSLPQLRGEFKLDGLTNNVKANFGPYGVPSIHAANKIDAVRSLGYLTARERLFQMDLMRRKGAGRLAEIIGQKALTSDIRSRTYGFNRIARSVVNHLSEQQLNFLSVYAQGINSYLSERPVLPFEFKVLGYEPDPWSVEDCILVAMNMFDTLTERSEREERMLSVMEKYLPQEIYRFLTPDSDPFTEQLNHFSESWRKVTPIPAAALKTLLAETNKSSHYAAASVALPESLPGSNAWAVNGTRTEDERAILANDMHLGISVPNIWFRVEMLYSDVHVVGVTLPGIPLIVAGSNEHVAWGATNLAGDFLDLVVLELNPDNPDEYRIGEQWHKFEVVKESITVKNLPNHELAIKQSIWGPVSPQPVLGNPVAIRWVTLDPNATNLAMIDLDHAQSVSDALKIANATGNPQLNFLAADKFGHIGWSIMGHIPKRYGFDGSTSKSWANGSVGWQGYLTAAELPRVIDPESGMLVSANHRRLGKEYPYMIGRQFTNGYRAYRISERLKKMEKVDEKVLFELQLDVKTDFFKFYQDLALSVLNNKVISKEPELAALRSYLKSWDGYANIKSQGLILLKQFRYNLAQAVFNPMLTACKEADPKFRYEWTYIDTPLQNLLAAKIPEILPNRDQFWSWDELILKQLKLAFNQLQSQFPESSLNELTWGKFNTAGFMHPFTRAYPFLSVFLNMPDSELPGCVYCVRVSRPGFGASERMVVSPSKLSEGILHMPGGQSGHPMSPHYRDQFEHWVSGNPLNLIESETVNQVILKPGKSMQ